MRQRQSALPKTASFLVVAKAGLQQSVGVSGADIYYYNGNTLNVKSREHNVGFERREGGLMSRSC